MSKPSPAIIFGKNLRFFRHKAELTQMQVAKRTGISHQSISHMETGKRKPNPEWIPGLAKALGIDPILLSYSDYTPEQMELLYKLHKAFSKAPDSPHLDSILATLNLIVK